jgi:hypothetical protein
MKTLAEILAALRAHLDANADSGKEIVKALRDDFAEEIATPLIGIGAAKGKGEVERTTVKNLTTERDELKAEVERLTAHTTELEKAKPDIEAVRLEGRETLRKVQEKHKADMAEAAAKVRDAAVARERKSVELELSKVVEGFAVESIADKAAKRIRANEDGSVDLVGADGIVLGPVTDPDAMSQFVKGLTKGLDPKIILAPGETGSDVGRRNRGGAGGGGAATKAQIDAEESQRKQAAVSYGI